MPMAAAIIQEILQIVLTLMSMTSMYALLLCRCLSDNVRRYKTSEAFIDVTLLYVSFMTVTLGRCFTLSGWNAAHIVTSYYS